MRFNCGLSYLEKHFYKMEWHLSFAWVPHRVGFRDCRWLEPVWRKGQYWEGGWDWKYRLWTDMP